MAGSLIPLLHLVLVEAITKPCLSLLESRTPLPVILGFHAAQLREKQDRASIFGKLLSECAQSVTGGERKMFDWSERFIADAGCCSLRSVEMFVAAAQKLLLALAFDYHKESPVVN